MTILEPFRDKPDVTLDLPKVSKHNWKDLEIRDVWSDPLEAFVEGRREVAQRALQDADHPRTILRRIVPTKRVSDIVAELPDEVDVAREDDNVMTTLALTSSESPVNSEMMLEQDIGPLDKLQFQGAPECCVDAYDKHRTNGQTDPIAEIARNTPSTLETGGGLIVEDPYPILNPMWAFQGWNFIDFYPCSYECDYARRVAIETGRLFRDIGKDEAAEAAYEFLTEPVYWSAYHGLAHVKGSWCIGEYTTDDYWHEEIIRFNGYHDEVGDVDSIDFDG